MKKHLLMLASWSMLMYGAFSFTSCKEDDDDDDKGAATELVEKYKDQKGATINGDDVVNTTNYGGQTIISVYHFNGDKLEKVTSYIDLGSHAAAEAIYNKYKDDGYRDVQIDGSVLSYTDKTDDEFNELSKEDLKNLLNGNYSGGNTTPGNDDNGGNTSPVTPGNDDNGGSTSPVTPGNDDNGGNTTPVTPGTDDGTLASVFKKYSDKSKGAFMSGNNIVYVNNETEYNQVLELYYVNDQIDKGIVYIDFKDEAKANEAYEEAKSQAVKDLKQEGTIISFTSNDTVLAPYKALPKSYVLIGLNSIEDLFDLYDLVEE